MESLAEHQAGVPTKVVNQVGPRVGPREKVVNQAEHQAEVQTGAANRAGLRVGPRGKVVNQAGPQAEAQEKVESQVEHQVQVTAVTLFLSSACRLL